MDPKDKFPYFDWKNTPDNQHPNGKNCKCPRHDHYRERIAACKQTNDVCVTLSLCAGHYKAFFEILLPESFFLYRILIKVILKLGLLKIKQLPYMGSDLCPHCKYGSGGTPREIELPPIP